MSPEARRLIELARQEDGPSRDDRARVRRALSTVLGAGAFVSSASSGAAFGGKSALAKTITSVGSGAITGAGATGPATGVAAVGAAKLAAWTGVGLLAGLTTAGTAVMIQDAFERDPSPAIVSVAPKASRVTTTESFEQTSPAPSARTRDRSKETPHAEMPRPGVSAPATTTRVGAPEQASSSLQSRGDLARELPLIEEAQRALHAGKAERALALLRQHAERFADGALVEERLAGRILALCALGRPVEARAAADDLERLAPRSPLWPRVLEACRFDE